MIRAIIFTAGELWIAQAIEHDICTDALTCRDAVNRLDATIYAERARYAELGCDLDQIAAAAATFSAMWDAADSEIHFEGQFYWRTV